MMADKKPPARINPPDPHDPFKMRTLEQILSLFDGGEFLDGVVKDHQQLLVDLIEHHERHGGKTAGSMTLTVNYALGKAGDVAMGAKCEFKAPKKPASSAAAYINDKGELTLYNPFMARMHQPVRDTNYDPDTGEVRDI